MFSPSRLTLARKRRGLTIAALSSDAKISTTSLSSFEGGRKVPAPDTLRLLARTLRFPEAFFTGNEVEPLNPDAVAFRARTKLAAGPRDAALSAGNLAVYLHEHIDSGFRLPTPDLPTLEYPSPETAAGMLRERWELGHSPIQNMVHLLEQHGVRTFSLASDYQQVDAFSFWNDTTPFVGLNLHKTPERSRFDAAHELGHLVMHHSARPVIEPQAEAEADAFASAFLMPRPTVLAYMPRGAFADQVIQGRKNWKVSAMSLAYRMHALGLLTEWQHRQVCIDLTKRGFRKGEPGGLRTHETSQVLAKVIKAMRARGQNPTHMANALAILPDELNGMTFGLSVAALDGGGRRATGDGREGRPQLAVVQGGAA